MALPGGYYVKNPDGSLSGPFYEQQPSPVYTPSVMSAPSPLPQAVAAAPLMPGTGAYFPKSVQEAWDNHFDAFGKQDVEKILLDYDQSSIAKVYNNVDGSKKEFTGIAGIREMFTELFGDLPDLKTLEAPIVEVDEPGKTVFLIWKCPGCGFNTATDTFVFGPDFKIKRQNIVVTKEGKEKEAKEGKAKTKKSGMCAWDLNFHHFCEEKKGQHLLHALLKASHGNFPQLNCRMGPEWHVSVIHSSWTLLQCCSFHILHIFPSYLTS